jgi:hypothetical protein
MIRINLKDEQTLKALEGKVKEQLKSVLGADSEDMIEYSPIPQYLLTHLQGIQSV